MFLISSVILFIHSLFFLLFPKWARRERFGFRFIYLFLCSTQHLSVLSLRRGLKRLSSWEGAARVARWGCGVEGRSLTAGRALRAERGRRALPGLVASSPVRGRSGGGGGGRSRLLAGSVQLDPYSSPAQRQLAPAGEEDPAALCARTLVSQPLGSSGES